MVDFASAGDIQSALVGTWVSCTRGTVDSPLPFSPGPGLTGITFGADGSWALTSDGEDGGQVATTESSTAGTFTVAYTPGAPEAYAVVTLTDGNGRSYDAHVEMAQSPLKVMFGQGAGAVYSAE